MLINVARYGIKVLPDSLAFHVIRGLAAITQRFSVSLVEQQAMAQATRRYYGKYGCSVAWSWGKEGPLIVLVHGWGGYAAQMAPLAVCLSQQGFRCITIDIRGHGESPLKHTRWSYLLDDIATLWQSLDEDIYAYIAHSAGALTTMAGRSLMGIHAKRYVCICAPSHPFPPINVIEKKLAPRKRVINRYREYIAEQFQTSWDLLQTGISYAGAGADMLLFYDKSDRFIPHSEGDKILALCPGSRLVKTNGYSHTKILTAPELAEAVSEFLNPQND